MNVYEYIKDDLKNLMLAIAIIIILADLIVWAFDIGYDNTDDKVNSKRSNMHLLTDYGTGCQYLGTKGDFVLPRVDSEGNHMCNTGK